MEPDADPFDGGLLGSAVRGIARVLAAFVIAALAFIAVIFIAQPVTNWLGHALLGPGIYAEYAGAGFVIALFSVWAGAQAAAGPLWRYRLSLLLFATGAYAAWRLLGSGYGATHCSGLAEIAAAYVGGGLGIILAGLDQRDGRRRPRRAAVIAGLLLPLAAFTIVLARAWWSPRLGVLTYAHLDLHHRLDVQRAYLAPSGGADDGEEIVWTTGRAADQLTRAAASGTIFIERDLGSGGSRARIHPVPNADVQSRVEANLRSLVPVRIASEIAGGRAPAVCARVPLPRIELSRARFFRVVDER